MYHVLLCNFSEEFFCPLCLFARLFRDLRNAVPTVTARWASKPHIRKRPGISLTFDSSRQSLKVPFPRSPHQTDYHPAFLKAKQFTLFLVPSKVFRYYHKSKIHEQCILRFYIHELVLDSLQRMTLIWISEKGL